jgi:hypothetical protein
MKQEKTNKRLYTKSKIKRYKPIITFKFLHHRACNEAIERNGNMSYWLNKCENHTKGILRKNTEVNITSKDPKYDDCRNKSHHIIKIMKVTETRNGMTFHNIKKYIISNAPFEFYASELKACVSGERK